MLIRQVEHRIILELMKGKNDFKQIASRLSIDYSTLNSLVRRLVTYDVIRRNDDGSYQITTADLMVASDQEVQNHRRNNPNRKLGIDNPLPLVMGEELEDLKEFIKIQCEEEVPRSTILKRLKRYGYVLSRIELLQFVEYFNLAPRRKKSKNSEVEVA
ncbi:hypothetical protein EHV15_35205 [Paenibacillus oralis]|uniref:Uncharacterized protein n=1 Tax=Paenibacillus oralis TaxID=2490856 RepID=A0A3P3TBB9_9BACL|nr:hypothetical protein [Paenibacillus oralis]RRJ54824.1 hypothetical protein EHV15_35205 [Paenibacillus oralis]